VGRFCAYQLTVEDKACTCKAMLEICTTPQGEPASNDSVDFCSAGAEGQPGSRMPDQIYAVVEATDWIGACGCPSTPQTAQQVCCIGPTPEVEAGSCSVGGGPNGLELMLPLMLLLALWRRRVSGRR